MADQVPYADIVDKETDGENAALLINDTKRAINELIVDTDASFKSFDSLTSAIAFVTANPNTIERLSTASYRDEAECGALGIDYPDGGGADYTVVSSGTGVDDGGSFINAGTKQLKLIHDGTIYALTWGCIPQTSVLGHASDIQLVSFLKYGVSISAGYVNDFNNCMFVKSDTGAEIATTSFGTATLQNGGIYQHDTAGNARQDLITYQNGVNFTVKDFRISGNLLNDLSETNQSQSFTVQNTTNLSLINMNIDHVRYMATSCKLIKNVVVEGGSLFNILRDGWRFSSSNNVRIVGTKIENVSDDCVALHTLDGEPSLDTLTGSYTVAFNDVVGSQSMKFLGGRSVSVFKNNFSRMIRGCIDVRNTSPDPEGNNPIGQISIKHNTIRDTLSIYGSNTAVVVQSRTTSLGGLPALPSISTEPYDYYHTQFTSDNTGVNVGTQSIDISHNTIERTLPLSGTLTSMGFNEILDRVSDSFVNPDMGRGNTQTNAIVVACPIDQLYVGHNNIIGQYFNGISLTNNGGAFGAKTAVLEHNRIKDLKGGVAINLAAFDGINNVKVRFNDIDKDPYFLEAAHQPDGSWSGQSGVRAILLPTTAGSLFEITDNSFRNCSEAIANAHQPWSYLKNNVMYCEPAVVNFSTSNKGIGTAPRASGGAYIYQPVSSDPTDLNYGKAINVFQSRSNALPTAGTFVAGAVISRTTPSLTGAGASEHFVDGWLRNTTGSGNVLGTDWWELRRYTQA